MTGLERNSEVVEMAAYAPLLVNTHSRAWPTNLIVFDNHRCRPSATCVQHHDRTRNGLNRPV